MSRAPLVVAMDGSTSVCSTALLRALDDSACPNWEVLAVRAETDNQGQARVLLRSVDEMLREIGAKPADLGSVVVGVGPGTFTGVRIAVATARGLALGLSVPVYGVSTLAGLAAGFLAQAADECGGELPAVVPVVDARRRQVFFAVYQAPATVRGVAPRWERTNAIGVCDRDSLGEVLREHGLLKAVVVGAERRLVGGLPDSALFAERQVEAGYLVTCGRWLEEEADVGTGALGDQHAERIIAPGAPELVRPIYVRAPDADVHITKMKDPWADGRDRA